MDIKLLGKHGEERAIDFLEKKGYRIIATNYLKRVGEIDIIAFDPKYNEYVFIEVKTRRSLSFGYPEESVNKRKISKIIRTAESWISKQNIKDPEWRIDVISIYLGGKEPEIEHIENVS